MAGRNGQDNNIKVEFQIGDHFYRATSTDMNSSRLLEAAATAAEDPNAKAHSRDLITADGHDATLALSGVRAGQRTGQYTYDTSGGERSGSFTLSLLPK